MNQRLNEILSTINGIYLFDDDVARQYISFINEAIDLIRMLETQPTTMLDNAKTEAIVELSNELTNRMNENFFNSPPERKRNDFKISKMLSAVAVGKVLSNMQSAE
jgi:hypothetical protein